MFAELTGHRLTFDVAAPLIPVLARLYFDADDSRRLLQDADLETISPRVNWEDPPGQRWYNIVDWALGVDGDGANMEKLLGRALDEHGDNATLVQISEPILAVVRSASAPVAHTPGIPPAIPQILVEATKPLVDRDEAVALLDRVVEAAAAGSAGSGLLLLGDSGIGKSRLADRAARIAAERGLVVLQAQCVGEAAEALLPIRDALAAYRGDRSVRDLLAEGGPALEGYLGFAESFLQLADGGRATRPLGGSRPQGVYEGLCQLLLGLATRSGLCLVVEDLTDADRDTLAFLEYLHMKSKGGRIVTISTLRRDLARDALKSRVDVWGLRGASRYEVPPLSRADAGVLIALLPKAADLPPERVERILNLAEGNAYFIEQLVSYAAEGGADQATVSDLPTTLKTVLGRRLDLVDRSTRTFLDAASVALENTQSFDLVAHVAGVRRKAALALLRNAVGRQCLREDPQGGVWFVQELLRRAVYEELGPNARVTLHGLAAERLESDGLLASAAHHYDRAGRHDDMIRTALEGAARAEYAGAYPTAAELYGLAMTAGDSAVGLRLARAHIVLGDRELASAVLNGLDPDAPEVRFLQAQIAFYDGRVEWAAEETEKTLPLLGPAHFDARIWLAGIYLYLGRLEAARDHAEGALSETDDPTLRARCKGIVGAALFFSGDLDGGERLFLEAVTDLAAVPTEQRDRFVYTTLLGNLAQVREARGDWATARRSHEEALTSRRAVSDARGVLQSLHAVARAEIGLGSNDAAREILVEARQLAARLGDALELAKIDDTEARLLVATGDTNAAIELATRALDRFRELRVAYDVVHARFSLAACYAAAGRERRAIEEGAIARVEAQRMRFGLLESFFPALAFSYDDRIAGGLLAVESIDAIDGVTDLIVGLGTGADMQADARMVLGNITRNAAPVLGLPVGWAFGVGDVTRRREVVQHLAGAMEPADAETACAAGIVAGCASWAVEGAQNGLILEIAVEEAASCVAERGADRRIVEILGSIASGTWKPDPSAGELGPYDTVVRALWCIATGRGPSQALDEPIVGRETSVAALVGGLVGARVTPVEARGLAPASFGPTDPPRVAGLARRLADLRVSSADA